jgi:beta-xylosidase
VTGLINNQCSSQKEALNSILQFMKTPVFARQLSPDGLSFGGERIKIIENDLPWEAHLVEGMWLTKNTDKYYLFYAANDFSTSRYGIGVAAADSPVGPFRKTNKQLLQSTAEWWAPGHPSVVDGPDGEVLLFLHAYRPGQAGYKQFRALLSIRITFREDEVLVFPSSDE